LAEAVAEAFVKLTSRNDADTESLRVTLLADVRQIFARECGVVRMFSKDLIDALQQMSERPWPEVCRGKPITERWLARNLAAFRIHSKTVRIGNEQAKGYELADFTEVFERYLNLEGEDFIRPTVAHEGKSDSSIRPKTENGTDAKTPFYEGMGRWDACKEGVGQKQRPMADSW
jgi:hypothetical protein